MPTYLQRREPHRKDASRSRRGESPAARAPATAEEAALAVARFLGPRASRRRSLANCLRPLHGAGSRADGARRRRGGGAEGLTLLRAENAAGFKYVGRQTGRQPFKAEVRHAGACLFGGRGGGAGRRSLPRRRASLPLAAAPSSPPR